jgi:hypothetical protein
MYLDYADSQARNGKIMYMKDWIEKLNAFLNFNEKAVLQNLGNISHELAIEKAETEFDKFSVIQDQTYESDFDKMIKGIKE